MNKKHTLKKTAAIFLTLALTVGATGCSFITTDSAKDMARQVANVDISTYLATVDGEEKNQATALQTIVSEGGISTVIPKRDLIAYFLNVGYQYVESYGYTYKDTFNMLMDTLVSRKIMTQYAMVYYLQKGLTAQGCLDYIDAELNAVKERVGETGREYVLLKAHPEVSAMKYFLTQGEGNDAETYDKAVYSLKKMLNDSLDSAETSFIHSTEETHNHGEKRTTPTNVGTEKADYYVKSETVGGETKSYEVYTGRNALSECYGYEAVDGSTRMTRMKAYNRFLANLQSNNLLTKGDNTTKLVEMDYYYVELASQLEQALITAYTDALAKEGEGDLTNAETGATSYLGKRYAEAKAAQKEAYDEDYAKFETAVGSLSDTTFALYAPQFGKEVQSGIGDFTTKAGFVYNILIPFSQTQNDLFKAAEARTEKDTDLYAYRTELLSGITAKDLRDSWFCEHEDENYAYEKDGKWYFFEDNFTQTDKYESLSMYLGKYAYNGSVTKKDDGSFTTKATKLPFYTAVDSDVDFLTEMENYLYTASGANVTGGTYGGYVTNPANYSYDQKKKEFTDYSEFVFYEGKVDVGSVSLDNYFVQGEFASAATKAAAAFNELMFAYSTDTGCLNTYLGYYVSPYKTSFVPEFEFAAQYAISKGAGTFVVAPSTYGWHIIYVTYAYDAGDVYAGFDVNAIEDEGTFSYFYYEAMREARSSEFANVVQTDVLEQYNKEECVTLYKDAYKDLLELDS